MLHKPLFWDSFILIGCIALFHVVAAHFHIYWTVPFFDILMHFLGGFRVGLSALWLFFVSDLCSPFKRETWVMIFAVVTSVLVVGLGWEVFEFLIELTSFSIADKTDTLIDIVMDLLGGMSAFLYFRYRLNDDKNKK